MSNIYSGLSVFGGMALWDVVGCTDEAGGWAKNKSTHGDHTQRIMGFRISTYDPIICLPLGFNHGFDGKGRFSV